MRGIFSKKKFLLVSVMMFSVLRIVLAPACAADKTAEEHFLEGREYYDNGQYVDAVASYTEAIKLKPKFIESYYARGAAFGMLGQTTFALRDFDKVLALNPKEIQAYFNKGLTYEAVGKDKEALAQYKLFLENTTFQTPAEHIKQTEERVRKLERKLNSTK